MTLRHTALLAMIALLGTFVVRTANSIWPSLYDSLMVARVVALWLLVASLFSLAFFWSLQSAWAGSGRSRLEAASRLATVGAALVVLLRLRQMIGLLRQGPAVLQGLTAFIELVSVLAMLWFFYVVYAELRPRLAGAGGALAGATLFAFGTLVTFLLHVLPEPPLTERSGAIVVVAIPLGLLAVAGLVRFLAGVRRHPQTLEKLD